MMTNETLKLVLLWPRDAPKWNAGTLKQYRLNRVFEEMAVLGIEPEPALYADDIVDQVRAQLLACDGVLVWVDPLFNGRNRTGLDAMLRDVAADGVWVPVGIECLTTRRRRPEAKVATTCCPEQTS